MHEFTDRKEAFSFAREKKAEGYEVRITEQRGVVRVEVRVVLGHFADLMARVGF